MQIKIYLFAQNVAISSLHLTLFSMIFRAFRKFKNVFLSSDIALVCFYVHEQWHIERLSHFSWNCTERITNIFLYQEYFIYHFFYIKKNHANFWYQELKLLSCYQEIKLLTLKNHFDIRNSISWVQNIFLCQKKLFVYLDIRKSIFLLSENKT